MTAFEFLCRIKYIPCVNPHEHQKGVIVCSKGERRRLLLNKAVVINGQRPGPNDEIQFPISEVTFFPNAKGKCSFYWDESVDKSENLLCESSI